jgi:carbonic anhydrase
MNRAVVTLIVFLLFRTLAIAQQPVASPAQHSAHTPAATMPDADHVWAGLVAGNKRFVAGKTEAHNVIALRKKLASGQQPNVIILSCSDSRVSPELVFDQSLGDLFVVRTAGNVADPVGLGSIEYAIDHIHSPLLVVLGHSKCGAVTAACSGDKMPTTNLEAIVDKIEPAVAKAKASAKPDELVETAIKENVHQSAKDLVANSSVVREAVRSGKIKIVEAEYELDSGRVVPLDNSAGSRN